MFALTCSAPSWHGPCNDTTTTAYELSAFHAMWSTVELLLPPTLRFHPSCGHRRVRRDHVAEGRRELRTYCKSRKPDDVREENNQSAHAMSSTSYLCQ